MSNSNWKIFFLEGDGNASCEKVQQGTEEHSSSPVPPHQLWFPLLNPIVNAAHEEWGASQRWVASGSVPHMGALSWLGRTEAWGGQGLERTTEMGQERKEPEVTLC